MDLALLLILSPNAWGFGAIVMVSVKWMAVLPCWQLLEESRTRGLTA